MCPFEAMTSYFAPRYFLIVLALAGDSTTTSVLPISGFSLGFSSDVQRLWAVWFGGRSLEGPLLLRSPRRASRAPPRRLSRLPGPGADCVHVKRRNRGGLQDRESLQRKARRARIHVALRTRRARGLALSEAAATVPRPRAARKPPMLRHGPGTLFEERSRAVEGGHPRGRRDDPERLAELARPRSRVAARRTEDPPARRPRRPRGPRAPGCAAGSRSGAW